MKVFNHRNIVKLLGVCTKGEPALAIMELMIHGMSIRHYNKYINPAHFYYKQFENIVK